MTRFKLALRYCKQHEDMLRADALANSLNCKQHDKFWKFVNKSNNSKATKFVQVIDKLLATRLLLRDGVHTMSSCIIL